MYNDYFGLEESPFSIAPDPRYLYMSEQHREALAHLVYGFNSSGGFVLLTGDVGTGKTTICRCLLEQIPEKSAIAFIFNPRLTVKELLASVCDEFGITYDKDSASIKDYVDLINTFLLDTHAKGVKAVLIIDEAQNLSTDVLEQLRLLTNLETSQHKLLHVILLGQPELAAKLSDPELAQLSQRIIARYHLGPLPKKDVNAYVNHRLKIAGIHKPLFSESVLNKLYQFTGGVPRLINVICDRALLGTFTQEQQTVSKATLSKAAKEVFGESTEARDNAPGRTAAWAFVVVVIVAVGLALASNYFKTAPVSPPSDMSLTPDADVIVPEADVKALPEQISWPPGTDIQESEGYAFKKLYQQWGIDYKPVNTADACSRAAAYGLQCMQGLRSTNILRNMNRPAVLKLVDIDGSDYYATLITLDQDTATIVIGTEEITVAIKDMESRWLGDYTLLWKPPDDYTSVFRAWYDGPVVSWLRTSMATINNNAVKEPVSNIYDNDLVRDVKKFQLTEGLVPDGIVGPQTIVHINTALGNGVPTLTEIKGKS